MRCASGSLPTIGNTLIVCVFFDLSAKDIVIFLCVNESVECGLKQNIHTAINFVRQLSPHNGIVSVKFFFPSTYKPESKLGFEDSLALQTSTLSHKQVIEVALQEHCVHIKHFSTKMQWHTEINQIMLKSNPKHPENKMYT